MAETVLHLFGNGVTYKLFDMPSRIKLIITTPPSMPSKKLDEILNLGCDVDVNVKDQTLHIGVPKKRKRKREQTHVKYSGSLDSRYKTERGENILRYILAVPDICHFDVKTEQVGTDVRMRCKNVECIPYTLIKHACGENSVVCDFPNHQLEFMLYSVD